MNPAEISAAPALSHRYETEKLEAEDDEKVLEGAGVLDAGEEAHVKGDLGLVGDELSELEDKLSSMTLERAVKIIRQLREMHRNDQKFSGILLARMGDFLGNPDILAQPDAHGELINEMKMEAILATENSPYQEVRANVDATDDPTMPSFTFRVIFMGTIFSAAGSFIDTLFLVRQPAINVGPNVAQLLAYPAGKFLHRVLPTRQLNIFGYRCTLNPGKFNKKEHMLITIMATVSFTAPYTAYLIPTQALPVYFDQAYARGFGYQLLATMGINFCGYGLAGLARRFIVYPSLALWPSSLATVALNKAFHTETNEPVPGPFGWIYRRSREQVFLLAGTAMFIWFFFPAFIFQALSVFNWISWIAPNNTALNNIVGFHNGLGLNPWPTFDWNNLTAWFTPFTIPTFAIVSQLIGIIGSAFLTMALYWTNAWNSSYLPINSNRTFDNTGARYNVSLILNDQGTFDYDKYQQYSQPWMSAGFIVYLFSYFAMYSVIVTYVVLYHRHEILLGWKSAIRGFRKSFKRHVEEEVDDLAEDVHYRLMQAYPEVPEWQYGIVLILAMIVGMISVGVWPTGTSPAVVVFGIIMPMIAILPCGLIQAVTGIPIPLQVLAQFIGGSFSGGNGIALMFFKSYGYISMYQALAFCNDLKLAHYLKLPPRHTFIVQLWATMINTVVSASLLNFQMSFKNICTTEAAFRFTCPGQNTFFTGAVFWGTIGPARLFGKGNRYNLLLISFPVGFLLVLAHYAARRAFPKKEWIRQIHPVMIFSGPSQWGSPYNFSYYWPNVMVTWVSFQYIRKRYAGFWAKYNYVIAAAFPAGIAIAAVVIFFCLEIPGGGLEIDWWGNSVSYEGCEGAACTRFELPDVGYFGPAPGSGLFT